MDNNVLACIDQSSYTHGVCGYAAWASLRLGAPLEFAHVIDRHPERARKRDLSGNIGLGTQESLLEELAALDERHSKIAMESGRILLEGAKRAAATHGVADSEARQWHGELVETLADMEKQVRLFVIGKRGETGDSAPEHIGSNLERVVRALHRPILVATREFTEPKSILIAFDGGTTTRKGVEMIARSPLFKGFPCHVVMAGSATAAANAQLAWAKETLEAGGFQPKLSILEGDAEPVLSGYMKANAIDLLVMGAYGHSRIRQLIVGSTATAMLRASDFPILLLR